jgi:hypothetical protein
MSDLVNLFFKSLVVGALTASGLVAWSEPLVPVQLSQGSVQGTQIYIGGEEIWPFVDGQPHPYPSAVVWDVNDGRVPQVVRNCMKSSSELLANWVTNPHDPVHKALVNAKVYGVPTAFFLWTNNYTQGQNWMQNNYRRARSWNWQDSYLKFESTVDFLNASGVEVCHFPDKQETFTMINREARRKAEASGRGAQFVEPVWQTSLDNPLVGDPGPDRLELN